MRSLKIVAITMLTHKQSRFGFEYPRDYNGTKAAIRAGYSEAGAADTASRLLGNDEIQGRIAEREAEIAAKFEKDADWVFKQWADIADADPRELMQLVVKPCALCWPAGLQLEEPNPHCVRPIVTADGINMGGCGGRGYQFVKLADTNKISKKAAKLILSIKETKAGIEFKLRDQDAAVMNIARAVGLLKDRMEVSGPGGGPIQTDKRIAREMTTAELLAFLQTDELGEGTIEGTCVDVTANSKPLNELEAGSSP